MTFWVIVQVVDGCAS